MEETLPSQDQAFAERRHALALALVLLFAAAIRIYWNDVEHFFPRSDEGLYLYETRVLVEGGIAAYPGMVDAYLANPARWLYPPPLRWGYLGAATLLCRLTGEISFRMLATLSAIAGMLSVLLTYLIGAEVIDRTGAVLAAALMATSPLQLALGRRALADELFCLMFLVTIFTSLRYLRADRPRERAAWLIGWVAAATLTFAVKELFLMVYPLVLLFWWLRAGRRLTLGNIVIWMLPPLLFAAVFSLLSRSMTKFFQIAKILTSAMDASYVHQFQSGPPHRIVIDFLAIAPIVTVAATVAAAFLLLRRAANDKPEWHLLLLLLAIAVAHAILPSKNLRYIVEADPLARILAASLFWREIRSRGWGTIAAVTGVAINGAVELMIFVTIFVRFDVYDPVTDALLRALGMLPR
ncbi:MAG TPA: glycosyltransferase family 39 protein [Thermoanaerobaculia bacterium]|jgi:4-amino-4-deoxy-L-arabinose transferase-like glycosyltransferase|nr:glycosyltransferase family 39 protein [Thermoanaerobaculia bacterium]